MACQIERTNLSCIVGSAKNELGSSIVARADIRDVRLVGNQDLSTTKITQLQNTSIWVKQEVLRLYISMADSLRVNVRERAEQLVDVNLDL